MHKITPVKRTGLELKPQSDEAIKELGRSLIAFGTQLLSDGKIMEALSSFKEAVKVLPDNLEAYLGLAIIVFYRIEKMSQKQTPFRDLCEWRRS